MELVKQCVSLELAKQLKSPGVPQESLFYWGLEGRYLEGGEPKSYVTSNHYKVVYTTDGLGEFTTSYFETFYSAFTVAELGEMLPLSITVNNEFEKNVKSKLSIGREERDGWYKFWWLDYPRAEGRAVIGDENMADAFAKMLIWLIENRYLDFKNSKEEQV